MACRSLLLFVVAFTLLYPCQSVTHRCREATTSCMQNRTCSTALLSMNAACQTVYDGTGCTDACFQEYNQLISGPIGMEFQSCDCQEDEQCRTKARSFSESCYGMDTAQPTTVSPFQTCGARIDQCNKDADICREALTSFRVDCTAVIEGRDHCSQLCLTSLYNLLSDPIGSQFCLCQPHQQDSCGAIERSVTVAIDVCQGPLIGQDIETALHAGSICASRLSCWLSLLFVLILPLCRCFE